MQHVNSEVTILSSNRNYTLMVIGLKNFRTKNK